MDRESVKSGLTAGLGWIFVLVCVRYGFLVLLKSKGNGYGLLSGKMVIHGCGKEPWAIIYNMRAETWKLIGLQTIKLINTGADKILFH